VELEVNCEYAFLFGFCKKPKHSHTESVALFLPSCVSTHQSMILLCTQRSP